MNEEPSYLDDFMTELKASLSGASGDAVLRRINSERLLRLITDDFIEAHQAETIRIMPDNRLTGESGADFLIQIDDYDIRLEFKDGLEGIVSLEINDLPKYLEMLESNPSTVALIVVWTTDDLLALSFSVNIIRECLENPEKLDELIKSIEPLSEVLSTLVANQVKLWDVQREKAPRTKASSMDLRKLFEDAIVEAIKDETGRAYRNIERKQAANQFPVDLEIKTILNVLEDALAGASEKEMSNKLTRISRRGNQ